jgi:sugar phosphate permease
MRPTRIRHVVLWLTVAAYMITYIDRVVMSTALPEMGKELGLDEVAKSQLQFAFRTGYSLFQLPGGWFGDVVGPRRALSVIVLWWSAFTSLTVVAWSVGSLLVFRFLFGVGEAGAFPTATRSLSRWMLPNERGYSQGLTHAGSRLGAALTPSLVVAMMGWFGGWRAPFVIFGALGVLWAAVWYVYYRDRPEDHRAVNEAELKLIQGSLGAGAKTKQAVPWRAILSNGGLWNLAVMYFCYAWCIAIYIDWLPTYLRDGRHMTLREMGIYTSLPLLAATLGDFAGGWITDRLAERTGRLNRARRVVAVTGFLIAAAGVVPATLTSNAYASVAYTSLALFGLELTVGVSWAVPLDIGGDFAGSVSAVMNMCGNIGGAISTLLVGYMVKGYGWNAPFLVAAGFCIAGAILFTRIDATRQIFQGRTPHAH